MKSSNIWVPFPVPPFAIAERVSALQLTYRALPIFFGKRKRMRPIGWSATTVPLSTTDGGPTKSRKISE